MQNITFQDQNAEVRSLVSSICADWTRHLLTISEKCGPLAMVEHMYEFVAGAEHGAEAERSEGTATGAALATPHE